MYVDARDYGSTWQEIYKLTSSFVQPRPIALVSSLSANGVRNLAPFSFYNQVSANPPIVMFAPSRRSDADAKDTLHNIQATTDFVIATVTEAITERMNKCSRDCPPEVDEFAESGLTPRPATLVKPPLVEESPINIECTLVDIKRFGNKPGSGTVIFGQIVAIHVSDSLLAADGVVDPAKLKTVGRLGRDTYCRTTDRFDLPRPKA